MPKKEQEVKSMQTIEEIGKIIFNDEYWKGGNGGKFKAPYSNNAPKTFREAVKNRYLCGKIQEHIVLVDYDDEKAFDCRLKIAKALQQHCIVIKSPNKGGHFYWFNSARLLIKSNSVNKTLLTFSPVDYKCGIRKVESTGEIKESKCVGCVSKEDGTLREVVYANIKADGTLDEIPFYDLPLKTTVKYSFLDMGNGDGRNDGFFSYMNPIKAEGYSYEQYREIADLINKFLLADSFEADEFDTVTRREAWDSADVSNMSSFYNSKGQFLHSKFADYLMSKYHIVSLNGYIHSYQNGVYVPGMDVIEALIVKECDTLKRAARNEVLDNIRIKTTFAENTASLSSPMLIPFKNGLLDIEHSELLEFSPQYVVTNPIPWNYEPTAKSELLNTVLNRLSCGDLQIKAILEEIGGYCMFRSNSFKKAFMLTGDKDNGKSTYIGLLQAMLGDNNVANLDLKDLDERFSTAMMFGKLANLGDDISDAYKNDLSLLKKITSGDYIKAEEKGKKPFNFKPYVTCVFSANSKPRLNDPTGAATSRFFIVPLRGKFTKDDPTYDPSIREKIKSKEVVEAYIVLAVQGLQRLIEHNAFTVSTQVQEEMSEYEKDNNPILSFIEEIGEDAILNEPTNKAFQR